MAEDETLIEVKIGKELNRQASTLVCHFANDEDLRRMPRAEFEIYLRQKLEWFSDRIMRQFDKLYGNE